MKIHKHIFIYLIIPFFTIILLNGCSDDDEPPVPSKYNLNIIISPNESGTVSPSEGTYTNGTSIKLTGTPSNGYQFKEWKGNVTGITNPVTVLMNSDKSITGVFELKEIFKTYVPDDNFEK